MAAVALAQPLQLRPASVARPRLVITCSSLEALPPRCVRAVQVRGGEREAAAAVVVGGCSTATTFDHDMPGSPTLLQAGTCSGASVQCVASHSQLQLCRRPATCAPLTDASIACRTCTEAAAQARAALRRYREQDRAAPQARPRRLQVWLPVSSPGKPREDDSIYAYDASDWPGGIQQRFRRLRPLVETLLEGYSPSFVGMLESPADGIGVWRAGGGDTTVVTQVRALLLGSMRWLSCSAGSHSQGCARLCSKRMVPACRISTLPHRPNNSAAQVGNVNFAPFARLCAGDFGASVLDPGHTILAVNPTWTKSGDIGQVRW